MSCRDSVIKRENTNKPQMTVLAYNNHRVGVTYYLLLNLEKTEAAICTCNAQKQWLILVWAQWVPVKLQHQYAP